MNRDKKKIWQSYVIEKNRMLAYEELNKEGSYLLENRDMRRIAKKKGLVLKELNVKLKRKGNLYNGWAAVDKFGKAVSEIKTLAEHREDYRNKKLSF